MPLRSASRRKTSVGNVASGLLVEGVRWTGRRPFTTAAYHYASWVARTGRPAIRVGRLRTGARIELDLAQWMHREIFYLGATEPRTTDLFRRVATAGWTFFDVGANEGYYALMAYDLGGLSSHVVAFEPQPTLAHRLRRSASLNGYSLTVIEAACAASDGYLRFYESDQPDNSGTATAVPGVHSTAATQVRAMSLDSYCAGVDVWPDVLKIDVEGFELEVLKGFERGLQSRSPRLIVAELSDDPRHPAHGQVAAFLLRWGYRAHRIGERGTLLPFEGAKGVENVAFTRTDG